jgi:hypothetical protein
MTDTDFPNEYHANFFMVRTDEEFVIAIPKK